MSTGAADGSLRMHHDLLVRAQCLSDPGQRLGQALPEFLSIPGGRPSPSTMNDDLFG
ncbi:hypothetical protein MPL3365_130210 [Mesorhizobium plurifarium]|uniref:Uncharacterized protein n=1 Tax=Mesorhizobium plurifarium TaxID=69974 RepID=A0A090FW93_MESPL|nr:hypothetical protein MPL3365_130210 [Mesorhizobium plurifarium]